MVKVIIIVWKWYYRSNFVKAKTTLQQKDNCFCIDLEKGNKLIGFTQKGDTLYTEELITKKYNDEIKNSNKVLLLLHNNEACPGKDVVNKIISGLKSSPISGLQWETFGRGDDKKIYGVLIDQQGDFTKSAADDLDVAFNKVWDYYYLALEQKKNELIQLWLPLAIDIQRITERGKKDFSEELKNIVPENIKDNWDDLSERIKSSEIKSIFFKEENGATLKFDPYKIIEEIGKLNTDNLDSFYDDYINLTKDNFLPKWLKNRVEEIDKYIHQNSVSGE